MKIKLFYLAACMLLFASCSEEENEYLDDQGFPKTVEENLMTSGVIAQEFTKYCTWKRWGEIEGYDFMKNDFECFHSLEEFQAGRFAQNMEELPPVDWDSHTLVVCTVCKPYIIGYEGCHVYSHSDKYTIEVMYLDYLMCAYGTVCVAIVLPEKNVSAKDIKLIHTPAFEWR